MARFALVIDGIIKNWVEAEEGWEHPDGELVPDSELTESWAEEQGIKFARNGEDIKTAYDNKETIVLCGVGEQCVYDLLRHNIPEGCFIADSTGTTGQRKLSYTPWAKIEKRAQAFVHMMESDLVGPVWFPDQFSVTAFSSTGRMACILNDIPCVFGPSQPKEDPRVVAGTPGALLRVLGRIPENAVLVATGGTVTQDMLVKFLDGGRKFIDFYSSTDGGSIFMNKYAQETVFGEGEKPVVGPDGILDIPMDQVADKYLKNDVPMRDGRFVTGDRVINLGNGGLKVLGRKR